MVAILVVLPLAVTLAILKYDLFDVDRLAERDAAWLITTLVAAGVFALIVSVAADLSLRNSRVGAVGAAFLVGRRVAARRTAGSTGWSDGSSTGIARSAWSRCGSSFVASATVRRKPRRSRPSCETSSVIPSFACCFSCRLGLVR